MWIYKVVRNENEDVNWDEYCGFVVIAASAEEARAIANNADIGFTEGQNVWLDASRVDCVLIGNACRDQEAGVVLADFNAG
jgi:hypothetical protein